VPLCGDSANLSIIYLGRMVNISKKKANLCGYSADRRRAPLPPPATTTYYQPYWANSLPSEAVPPGPILRDNACYVLAAITERHTTAAAPD